MLKTLFVLFLLAFFVYSAINHPAETKESTNKIIGTTANMAKKGINLAEKNMPEIEKYVKNVTQTISRGIQLS